MKISQLELLLICRFFYALSRKKQYLHWKFYFCTIILYFIHIVFFLSLIKMLSKSYCEVADIANFLWSDCEVLIHSIMNDNSRLRDKMEVNDLPGAMHWNIFEPRGRALATSKRPIFRGVHIAALFIERASKDTWILLQVWKYNCRLCEGERGREKRHHASISA